MENLEVIFNQNEEKFYQEFLANFKENLQRAKDKELAKKYFLWIFNQVYCTDPFKYGAYRSEILNILDENLKLGRPFVHTLDEILRTHERFRIALRTMGGFFLMEKQFLPKEMKKKNNN